MEIGGDLAGDAARRAAVAVVEEWDAHRADFALGRKVDELRAAVGVVKKGDEPPLWDVDPERHFGRQAGKLLATVTRQADGTWQMVTADGRNWPAFRSAEAARRAFEEGRPASPNHAGAAPGVWERAGPFRYLFRVDGRTVGVVEMYRTGSFFWDSWVDGKLLKASRRIRDAMRCVESYTLSQPSHDKAVGK